MGTVYRWKPDTPHAPGQSFIEDPRRAPLGFFHAFDIPPQPWPHIPENFYYDPLVWGPPGSVWTFTEDQAVDRVTTGGDSGNVLEKLAKLFRKLGTRFVDGTGNYVVPSGATYDRNDPRWQSVKTVAVVVHGTLGTVEEVAHTFHLVHSTDPNHAATVAEMKGLADTVRDRWVAFVNSSADNSAGKVLSYMPQSLKYDFASARYVDQPPAGKPTELVATQYSNFGALAIGSNQFGTQDLPWEVSMAVGLNTNFRGPRFRGRTYLGPFVSGVLGGNGLFNANFATKTAAALGTAFIDNINQNTVWDFHVLSRKYGTSAPIQGTRAGVVPDSQRRRRKSQPEAYVQAWGAPIGGAA